MDISSKDNTDAPFIKELDVIKQLNAQKNEINRLKTMNKEAKKLNHSKTFLEDNEEDGLVQDTDINRKLTIRDKIV